MLYYKYNCLFNLGQSFSRKTFIVEEKSFGLGSVLEQYS